jgi:hypothetical protein
LTAYDSDSNTQSDTITVTVNNASGIVFSDDFEGWGAPPDIGPWDSKHIVGTNVLEASTVIAGPGSATTLHCKDYDTAAQGNTPSLSKALTPASEYYIRFYVYLPSGYSALNGTAFPLRIVSATGRRILLYIGSDGSMYMQGDGDWTGTYGNYYTLNEQTWYRIEVLAPVPTAASQVRWWWDGVELVGFTDDFADAGGTWNSVDFGIVTDTPASAVTELYFDDFAVGSSQIGP